MFFYFVCYGYVEHRVLHVLSHSFPTRSSSDLLTAGEIVAEGVRQILAGVADRELGRPRDRADRVLDVDVEPVGGQRQARDDTARLDDRTDRPGRRAFGLQIFIAADGRQDRVA